MRRKASAPGRWAEGFQTGSDRCRAAAGGIYRTRPAGCTVPCRCGTSGCGGAASSAATSTTGGDTAGSTASADTNSGVVEVTITSFKTGENVGAIYFEPQVERYNETYAGKYKINLESVPQDSIFNDRIKQLAQQNKLPNQLSGGQQQRTATGRAIVKIPDILLCDEPTGALDYKTSKEILKLIETVNQKYGNTIIMVTHNDAIKDMADRVV